jgi:hypothetical protein
MRTRWRGSIAGFALILAGCMSDDASKGAFALPRISSTERAYDPSQAPQASPRIATRVVTVGNDILAANRPDVDFKPVFFTSGTQEPQIFHVNKTGMIVLSEGLVERCSTDAELAAAICHELGKMAAEKSDRASPANRLDAPPSPRLAPDIVGSGHAPDMTRQAEEALYDRRNPTTRRGRDSRPDSHSLAQTFLAKAGHSADDLKRIETLLKEAEENGEKRRFLK